MDVLESRLKVKDFLWILLTTPEGGFKGVCERYGIPLDLVEKLETASTIYERAGLLQYHLSVSAEEGDIKILLGWLSTDQSDEKRSALILEGLNDLGDSLLRLAAYAGMIGSVGHVKGEVRRVIENLSLSVLQIAEAYPHIPPEAQKRFADGCLQTLNPNKVSTEDLIVAMSIFFEFIKPYIVDRLLSVNPYEAESLTGASEEIARDVQIVRDFYDAIKEGVQFVVEGKCDLSDRELAEKLFKIGPLFAKLVQSFGGLVPKGDEELHSMAQRVTAFFQEGIAMPSKEEAHQNVEGHYEGELPAGLALGEPLSSASIAQVIAAEYRRQDIVLKIKRPAIASKLADNVRLYGVLIDMVLSFVRQKAAGTEFEPVAEQIQRALPFSLEVLRRSFEVELDFEAERVMQQRATEMFSDKDGIYIPQVIEEISGTEVIAMQRVDGERLKNMPASPQRLANMFRAVFCLLKTGVLHGDLHGGNLKGARDGDIILYDWGQHSNIEPQFFSHIKNLAFSGIFLNPRSLAKALFRLQDQEFNQSSIAQIEAIVKEVKQVIPKGKPPQPGLLNKLNHALAYRAETFHN